MKTVRADEKSEGRDTVMREHVSIFVFDLQGSVARRHLEHAVEVSLGRCGDLDVLVGVIHGDDAFHLAAGVLSIPRR